MPDKSQDKSGRGARQGQNFMMIGLLCASPFAFPASVKHVRTDEADKKSIQQQFERWIDAYERGDAQTVTSTYAPDAILLLPNRKPIEGAKQLRAFLDQLCVTKVTFTYKVNQLAVTGNCAFRWGSAQVIVHRKQAGGSARSMPAHLKFIDIWEKEPNGAWKIYRDSSVIDTKSCQADHRY